MAKNREWNFTVCSDSLSQSIGRDRVSWEGALDIRESWERRDNIVPKFSPERQKKRNFGAWKFPLIFLSRIACCSRESRSAWPNSDSRIQLAPHARRRAVPMTESGWIPVLCVNDEVANSGGTGITNAYTHDMLSRERIMDCIKHRSLGDNTIY